MANPIKAIKSVKKITAGKAKVNRKVEKLDTIAEGRTGGNLSYIYKKGKLIERFENHPPIKTKPRALTKRINQMAPSKKREIKNINKIVKNEGKAIKPNVRVNPRTAPKVPVKRRGK